MSRRDPKKDAEAIHKATVKKFGTDEDVLIDIIGKNSRDYLVEVGKVYKKLYGKTLHEVVWGETREEPRFAKLLYGRLRPLAEWNAELVRKATDGLGTTDFLLQEVVCFATNKEIENMKDAYYKMYDGKHLENDVIEDTSGKYRRLLIEILKPVRDERGHLDIAAAAKTAKNLHDHGEGKHGTNEQLFIDVMTHNTFPQIYAIGKCYEELVGNTLQTAFKKEMSGEFAQALSLIVTPIHQYAAEVIYNAGKGMGTEDKKVIYILARLERDDLSKANEYFTHHYGVTMNKFLADENKGLLGKNFAKLVQAIVPKPTQQLVDWLKSDHSHPNVKTSAH